MSQKIKLGKDFTTMTVEAYYIPENRHNIIPVLRIKSLGHKFNFESMQCEQKRHKTLMTDMNFLLFLHISFTKINHEDKSKS